MTLDENRLILVDKIDHIACLNVSSVGLGDGIIDEFRKSNIFLGVHILVSLGLAELCSADLELGDFFHRASQLCLVGVRLRGQLIKLEFDSAKVVVADLL